MDPTLERMRRDWDERARQDAERHVYTRDAASDVADFELSGVANFNQLLRPYLPILLGGRPPGACRAVEIGCGVGRMTRSLARAFSVVDAVDVSRLMLEQARERLKDLNNVAFHPGSGCDLSGIPDVSADLVFSYIVFQHIPSRAVIENYVREAARVLKPGGSFKFQLNGDNARVETRDTWLGESFSLDQARRVLADAGFSLLAAEGAGTQYFVLTARKGEWPADPGNYLLPGEDWAPQRLVRGFGAAVESSWRPVEPSFAFRLSRPTAPDVRFFAGLYFWPEDAGARRITLKAGEFRRIEKAEGPGDWYMEFPIPDATGSLFEVRIDPPCGRPPAFRVAGCYETANQWNL